MIKALIAVLLICAAAGAQDKAQAERLTWQKLQYPNSLFVDSTTIAATPGLVFTSTIISLPAETWMIIKDEEMSIDGLSTECTVFNLHRAVKLTALTVSYHSFQTPEAKWVRDVMKACEGN